MKEQITTSHFFIIFFTLAFGLVFIVTSCQQADRKSAASQNEELAMQYIEAYNTQDIDALQSVLADRIQMYGEEHEPGFLLDMIRGAWGAFPDITLEPTVIAGSDDYVTVRLMVTGTGAGEFLGYDIDGEEFRVTETILFGITDGRISEYSYNWDELGFWEQLGVVESPYPEE